MEETEAQPNVMAEMLQSHPWYVAHTRPRCEKKLVAWCGREDHACELQALETMEDVWLVPNIGVGTRVLIQRGPLAGLEAWVEERHGPTTALLRLDFIGQAAAVNVSVEDLELV